MIADDGLMLTNDGTITSQSENAVEISGDGGVVINTGSIISATEDAIRKFGDEGDTFTLTNSGLIQGGTRAFIGDESNETLNLNLGSRIIGTVDGFSPGDSDVINFDGGLTSFTDAADGAASNSILGDVLNIATINKTGSGVAFIGVPGNGGFNVETDTINITSGGLYINGDITGLNGEKATINSGGAALGGTGVWNANVNITAGGISAGAIPINLDANPSNSVGQVTITGDVDHSPGSFIRFDVNPGTPIEDGINSDLIRQTGAGNTYDVSGANIRIATTDNNRVIQDGTYTVVSSDEAITGDLGNVTAQLNPNVNQADTGFIGSEISPFATSASNNANTVLANNFTTASISDDGTDIILTVDHDFSSLTTDGNGSSFGNALDAVVGGINAFEQDFIAALDFSNLATVQSILNSISPVEGFAAATNLASGNNQINRVVRDHLALTRASDDIVKTFVGSYAKQALEPAPAAGSNRFNTWGNFNYTFRNIDSDLGRNLDGEEASFTVGIDYRVAPNLLFGILLNGSTADNDFDGGNSDSDSYRALIYGTYGRSTGIYSDFLVGYGTNDTDVSRNGGILGTLNTSPDADSFQAMITVGYAIQSGAIKHGPFVGFEYQYLSVDGFNQGGIFPIGVNGFDIESARALAGYRADIRAGRFNPYVSVAYAQEFQDGAVNTNAILPGGSGFIISGSGFESGFLISAGTNYSLTEDLSVNAGYYGEVSTHRRRHRQPQHLPRSQLRVLIYQLLLLNKPNRHPTPGRRFFL